MKKLLILLIVFACSTGEENAERTTDGILNSNPPVLKQHEGLAVDRCGYEVDGFYVPENDPMFQIEWIGNWQQMTIEDNGKTGRYPLNKDFSDTARYDFYGHGIDVMTEVSPKHSGYQVIIDGVLVKEVITHVDSEVGTDVKTFSESCLDIGNHRLELVRLNDTAPFVINGLQINFYVNPDLQGWNPCYDDCLTKSPCVNDTIYIEVPLDTVFVYDTIFVDIPGEPIYLRPYIYVVADSAILINEEQ